MAAARAELEGELVAHLVRLIPAAVWAPDKLPQGSDLNPFAKPKPVSEAMREHLRQLQRRRLKGLAGE